MKHSLDLCDIYLPRHFVGTDFYLPVCSNPITTGVALENQMSYLIALRKENQEKRVVGIMWQELP